MCIIFQSVAIESYSAAAFFLSSTAVRLAQSTQTLRTESFPLREYFRTAPLEKKVSLGTLRQN